jgi:hypothetical protein
MDSTHAYKASYNFQSQVVLFMLSIIVKLSIVKVSKTQELTFGFGQKFDNNSQNQRRDSIDNNSQNQQQYSIDKQ